MVRIGLVLNDDFSMYHFRGGLIRELIRRDHEVCTIVPPGRYGRLLAELGARCIYVPMHRFISPVKDISLFWKLYQIFRSEQFDIVHTMTIKPNIYGMFAARLAGVRRKVCLVSGSGFLFLDEPQSKIAKWRSFVTLLYKAGMALSDCVWFQNPDDMRLFTDRRLASKEKSILIKSGGINLEEYSPNSVDPGEIERLKDALGLPGAAPLVLMVSARMIWSKGVREYIEAVRKLHDRHREWYFLMICPKDNGSPDSVPAAYIKANKAERLIVIDTFVHDIKKYIGLADILVLPSYYPEGVPRVLLEGLAMAKPIVTTDHPGCRETVREGENGFLIPVKNSAKLAEKLEWLMRDGVMRKRFGSKSRERAEQEFDESLVVKRILSELYGLRID
jgi:N,N'-diacetylbacillosaminyl-diphospho-undecaprenol alpha-1,3-N-acetylgalactosaminyltransferase